MTKTIYISLYTNLLSALTVIYSFYKLQMYIGCTLQKITMDLMFALAVVYNNYRFYVKHIQI